jgi:hypothetical protein
MAATSYGQTASGIYYARDNRPAPSIEDLDPEELEDMLIWMPEPEPYIDFMEVEEQRRRMPVVPQITPSQFTEFAFRMPKMDGLGYENFSFGERRHMRRPYDTPARRLLLFCGRQVEKSTLLGNIALCYSCMLPNCKTLYVSPSATQTKTFSVDRIKEPIETSDVLRAFTTKMLSMNVFEKQFVNRSKITLRYAFLNADRTRGIPAWMLMLDEIQDILFDNIPVIEQCTAHAPPEFKRFVYSGTPKSLDNGLESYRQKSTQGEWVVPCDNCGSGKGPERSRYWNVLGEKNIGKKGVVCEKCKKLIDPMHKDSQWAFMVRYHEIDAPYESYRIPQLMVPWRIHGKGWQDVLLDYERYPRDRFYNEVLGISYDSGTRPLTMNQLKETCNPAVSMHPDALAFYKTLSRGQSVFAGIDWGTGEHAYTVLTLGTYIGTKFRIFYIHRFIGEDIDPVIQMEKIISIIKTFNCHVIGTDYGGGFYPNDTLVRTFGVQRVQKYQYAPRPKRKVEWKGHIRRWMVHRTEVMSDVFNAIKRNQFEFPNWDEFKEPYARDFLNIFSEYNETLRVIQYQHGPDKPDDSFHSTLYCFLASQLVHPRPDIIVPRKEDPTAGPMHGVPYHPTDQG